MSITPAFPLVLSIISQVVQLYYPKELKVYSQMDESSMVKHFTMTRSRIPLTTYPFPVPRCLSQSSKDAARKITKSLQCIFGFHHSFESTYVSLSRQERSTNGHMQGISDFSIPFLYMWWVSKSSGLKNQQSPIVACFFVSLFLSHTLPHSFTHSFTHSLVSSILRK